MQFRVGKCGSCNATFKVPATFGGDKAKCKSCGTGVVEIGPVQGGGEPELQEHKPSGKKDGPSMMEKLRAERAAAAAKPVPAKRPAAMAAPAKAAPAKRGPAKPVARKAAVPVKRAAAGAGAGAAKAAGGDRPARPSRSGGAASRTSARRAGGSRSRSGGDDEGEEGGGRRGRAPQKKSPAPMIAAIVVILAIGIGAWQMLGGDKKTKAADSTETDVAANGNDENAAGQSDGTEDVAGDTGDGDGAGTGDGGAEAAASNRPKEVDQPEDDTPTTTNPDRITASTPDADVDPNEVDLSAFEFLPKDPDCSDDEWASIVELAAAWADPDGARGSTRAQAELADIGRFAYPAMVNEMLKLDLTTPEGDHQGDFLQKSMQLLLGGMNYGWKYDFADEPNKTALFNKKVVRSYYKTAGKIAGSWFEWNRLSKNDANQEEDPRGSEGASVADDLDDLDDF